MAGNASLGRLVRRFEGRVLGVFFFDRKFLARPDFSPNRFGFFLSTLRALREEMRALGGDLLVLDGGPQAGWESIKEALILQRWDLPVSVSFNRDYEPFALKRDEAVTGLLQNWGWEVSTERDHLLFEPHEICPQGKASHYYKVFTPYSKVWLEKLSSSEGIGRIRSLDNAIQYLKGSLPKQGLFCLRWPEVVGGAFGGQGDVLLSLEKENQRRVTVLAPPAGTKAALSCLESFESHLASYKEDRDCPALEGTSKISMYLKNGSLTVPLVIRKLELNTSLKKAGSSSFAFLRQLVWREFYYALLFHCPWVENRAFRQEYVSLPWENREDWFQRWKDGTTGYPIVDAAMRQLRQTGWMHNRCRMIVASFLTKDLLIDWRWGEQYFMEQLLDGDLALNNGGWQWAASTGCDPQPYFRIFNPVMQSKKFDPEGRFIRAYVPELRHLSEKHIHAPWERGGVVGYPEPMVDHGVQRLKALNLFRGTEGP